MFNPTSTFLICLALAAPIFSAPASNHLSHFTNHNTRATAKGASCVFPKATKTKTLKAPQRVAAGKKFDGANVRFDRGAGACLGQAEGGQSAAVFLVEEGGTLSNVIIGANQAEGVHCLGACTLKNDVCEDAVTIKQKTGTSTITGGGAKGAADKVIQHNGGGTVKIDNFCVEDFGKLYRNCKSMPQRNVVITNVTAKSGKLLCGINSNYGDTCTVTNTVMTAVDATRTEFEGNNKGSEPKTLKKNQKSQFCKFLNGSTESLKWDL